MRVGLLLAGYAAITTASGPLPAYSAPWQVEGSLAALQDGHEKTRLLGLEALAALGLANADVHLKAHIKTMRAIIQAEDPGRRARAVRAVSSLGFAAHLEELMLSQLEREEDSDVAKALTEALGALDEVDESRLIGMVQSRSWVTREWAVRLLAAKGGAGRHADALLSQLEREGLLHPT